MRRLGAPERRAVVYGDWLTCPNLWFARGASLQVRDGEPRAEDYGKIRADLKFSDGRSIRNGGAGGIRTLGTSLSSYAGLANQCLQPLGHSSVASCLEILWHGVKPWWRRPIRNGFKGPLDTAMSAAVARPASREERGKAEIIARISAFWIWRYRLSYQRW